MIKILLLPEVFTAALKGQNQAAAELIKKSQEGKELKAWTLASTIRTLAEQNCSKEEIQSILAGIPKIPVNDRLSQEALESEHGFDKGLQLAAAKMFKLSAIVAEKNGEETEGVRFLSIEEGNALQHDAYAQNVNFMDLSLAVHPIFDQVDAWHMDIIQNTAFAGGSHVTAFEKEFAEYCGAKHAVGVASGTDALRFALVALGVQPGDEVITVPNTFIATTEAISQAGAKPVFVDVLPDTYNMNPESIEAKITDKTKVILPVHLYGQIVDMDPILAIAEKHGLKVLEDACQAHGAEYKGRRAGSIGHAAAFSLYPGKNLGAYGEAGCAVTNDPEVAATMACLKDHGQSRKYYHKMEGYNGRMDNLQAAACRAKLPLMDDWNQSRREVAQFYKKYLGDCAQVTLPTVPEENTPVFHIFIVLVDEPQKLHQYLQEQGIFSSFHYPVPLHLQDAYQDRGEGIGSYPVTEKCADSLLSLPMFPELTEAQVKRVCDTIKKFYE